MVIYYCKTTKRNYYIIGTSNSAFEIGLTATKLPYGISTICVGRITRSAKHAGHTVLWSNEKHQTPAAKSVQLEQFDREHFFV